MVQAHAARHAGVAYRSMGYAVMVSAIVTTTTIRDGQARLVQGVAEDGEVGVTRFGTAVVVSQATDYKNFAASIRHQVFVGCADLPVTKVEGTSFTQAEQSRNHVSRSG